MLFHNVLLISAASLAGLVFPTVLGAPSTDGAATLSGDQTKIVATTQTLVTQMNQLTTVAEAAAKGATGTDPLKQALHNFLLHCAGGHLTASGGGGDLLSVVLGGAGGTSLGGLLGRSGAAYCLGGPIGELLALGNLSHLLDQLGPEGLLGGILNALGLGYLLDPSSTASLINDILIALFVSLKSGACSRALAIEILTLVYHILSSLIDILNLADSCRCAGGAEMIGDINTALLLLRI
ncbi:hypothetical protein C8R46DRAFT_1326704 [Mycena filopes]|nr:hypothetical protein C8R46DRAFT_1326704 [Mycena filopes]